MPKRQSLSQFGQDSRKSLSVAAEDLTASFASLFNSSHSTWLTQVFIVMTFFWGLFLAIVGNKTAEYLPERKWVGSGNCAFGVLMLLSSVMAACVHCISQKTRLLLFYQSMLLVSALGIVMCSGASYFYRQQVAVFVSDNWEEEVITAWPNPYTGVLAQKYGADSTSSGSVADRRRIMDYCQSWMILNAVMGWLCQVK